MAGDSMDNAITQSEAKIMDEAAKLIEFLRAEWPDGDWFVGNVVIAADLLMKDENEKIVSPLVWQGNDPRDWVNVALLKKVTEKIEEVEARVEERED